MKSKGHESTKSEMRPEYDFSGSVRGKYYRRYVESTNVVVLDVQEDRSYADPKYGHIPKAVLIGKGKAWVFTGGKYVDAFWSKSSQTARIILTDASGAAINLAPGNTWVELKPNDPEGKLTIVPGAGAGVGSGAGSGGSASPSASSSPGGKK